VVFGIQSYKLRQAMDNFALSTHEARMRSTSSSLVCRSSSSFCLYTNSKSTTDTCRISSVEYCYGYNKLYFGESDALGFLTRRYHLVVGADLRVWSSVHAVLYKVESNWNVMAHGDAWEGKWRGNWRMKWVASTPHTTSEHGISSITTADAHTSAASSRLNWRPRRFK
jgi:hypothetical protein